jgi:hypothetical protein
VYTLKPPATAGTSAKGKGARTAMAKAIH